MVGVGGRPGGREGGAWLSSCRSGRHPLGAGEDDLDHVVIGSVGTAKAGGDIAVVDHRVEQVHPHCDCGRKGAIAIDLHQPDLLFEINVGECGEHLGCGLGPGLSRVAYPDILGGVVRLSCVTGSDGESKAAVLTDHEKRSRFWTAEKCGKAFRPCKAQPMSLADAANSQEPGPFYHGTRADLKPGDLLEPGGSSNYGERKQANFIYLTATLDAATWGAELAVGEGPGRIYRVEPTGPVEDDPNLTDKKFPGNPTRSYRTRQPLRVVSEVLDWEGHPPHLLQAPVSPRRGR